MLRDDSVNRLKNQNSMVANDSLIIKRTDLIQDEDNEDFDEPDTNQEEMFPMDHDDIYMVDRKSNIKKGFFSMIDNVLGGAQSKNISMISNTYSQYQNMPQTVKAVSPKLIINPNINDDDHIGQSIDISPTLMKQQKLFDNNTTMMSSNYINSFITPNNGPHLDNSLFESKPNDTCYTSKGNFSNNMLFQ